MKASLSGTVALITSLASPCEGRTAALVAPGDEQPEPNVVVILMDDVGTDFLALYDEVNPYQSDLPYVHGSVGGGDAPGNGPGTSNLYVHAPNLEALAAEGVLFLNAYATPLCSPTRASLYTGVYPHRHGVGGLVATDNARGKLREFGDPGFARPTLAELVRSSGYADVLVGKWHLSLDDFQTEGGASSENLGWEAIPTRGMWSEWRCVFNNVDSLPRPPPKGTYYNFYFNRDYWTHAEVLADPSSHVTKFATTVQLDEARDWCNAQTEPFLCVIATNAAHSPWGLLPPAELTTTDEYVSGPENTFTRYCANLESLDAEIGAFLDGLAPHVREATVVMVLGDNGTPEMVLEHARQVGWVGGLEGSGKDLGETYDFLLDDPGLRFKSTVYERGARVPMIVAGPGVVAGGRESRALVDVVDLFATIAELVHAEAGEVQGISFAPVLRDEVDGLTHARDFTLTELFEPQGVIGPGLNDSRRIGFSLRIAGQGRYKLVRDLDSEGDRFYRLQDVFGGFVDPFETEELPHGLGDPARAEYELVLRRLSELLLASVNGGPDGEADWATFCSADANSTGSPARMAWGGSASVTANDLFLAAGPVPNQPGLFFFSSNQLNGGAGQPFGNGTLCLGGNGSSLFRMRVVEPEQHLAGARLDFTAAPGPPGMLAPGTTWSFQMWFRDPAAQGAYFDLSDGLELTFGP